MILAASFSSVSAKGLDSAVGIWDTLVKTDSATGKAPKEVKKMMGQQVEVVGYMIINEFESGKVTEFLLARTPSGCIHVPLPSANSIIHVKMQAGHEVLPQTGQIRVKGIIALGGRMDAIYEMTAESAVENKGS